MSRQLFSQYIETQEKAYRYCATVYRDLEIKEQDMKTIFNIVTVSIDLQVIATWMPTSLQPP